MANVIKVDLAIIGAGTAGISAFKEASKVTKNILLIDHGPLGTTCARVGCMPSKVLIQVAEYFHNRVYFRELGIEGAEALTVDMKQVMIHVRKLRDYFTQSTIKYVEDLGPQFIQGTAQFLSQTRLKVDNQEIEAKRVIIAVGTHSIVPGPWQAFGDKILTSEIIFEQKDFAKRLAVIGAGAIGLELGQALARLGIDIQMFDALARVGGLTDPQVNQTAIEIFRQEFPIHLEERANLEQVNGELLVKTNQQQFLADQVLAALGRTPNLKSLNLSQIGIPLDEGGLPTYNLTTMQIADSPLFIAGDAGKFKPFLHEAADEGRIAGYNAVRDKLHCFKRRTPLGIIFSEPNIATVGKSYHQLQGQDFVTGEVSFADQGRSRIMAKNAGILHVYAARDTGVLLGAEMVAPLGEHLAHLLAGAIQQRLTVFDMLQMPFYHPVIEEGMRTALRDAASQAVSKQVHSFDLVMCNSEALAPLS